jgi:ERCC4-type nuclease
MSTKPDAPVFTLPALRSLGDLAGAEPVIVIDSREPERLPFRRLKTHCGPLITGDYSVAGLESLFAVERKSISDLVGFCIGQNRERFDRELHRLRGLRFNRLLVVGSEAHGLSGSHARWSRR